MANHIKPEVIGRYTIIGNIAAGGMATVYYGRLQGDRGFSKLVAIKRLHPQFASDAQFVSMFLDEARVASRIQHPNVVQPLDVVAEEKELLLVMEYIRGESIARLLRRLSKIGDTMPLEIISAVMVGALHGLHAAHEAKSETGQVLSVVHRDVSPQNIIVGMDGVARVIDFGIAKAAEQSHRTVEGEVKGKLAYMAPEQIVGNPPVDRRTDIYSASVVLWEMITMRRLFKSDETGGLMSRMQPFVAPPPSSLVSGLPFGIDEIVLRGLGHRQSVRFPTAYDMAVALEQAVPPAAQSLVAQWVDSLVGDELRERDEHIASFERSLSDRPPPIGPPSRRPALPKITEPMGTVRQRNSDPPVIPTLKSPLDGHSSETPAVEPEFRAEEVIIPPRERMISAPDRERISQEPGEVTPPGAAPRTTGFGNSVPPINRLSKNTPVGPAPVVAIAPPMLPEAKLKGSENITGGQLAAWGAITLAVVLGGGYFLAPILMKRASVEAVAAFGFKMEVESTSISTTGTTLKGVTLTAAELPWLYAKIPVVELPFDRRVDKLVVRDAEVVVEGRAAEVSDSLGKWLKAHPSRGASVFEIQNSQFFWGRIFGDNTKLSLEDVSGTVETKESVSFDDTVKLDAKEIRFHLPVGDVGPWFGRMEHRDETWTARVAFNSSETSHLSYLKTQDEDVSIDANIVPATNLALGISYPVLGLEVDETMILGGYLKFHQPKAGKLTTEVGLDARSIKLKGAAARMDLRSYLNFSGDNPSAMEARGAMLIGSFRSRVWGKTSLTSDNFRADLLFRSAPKACERVMTEPAPPFPLVVGDLPALERAASIPATAGQTILSGSLTLDSRDLGQTNIVAGPSNRCGGLKVFP